jgi:predicted nicotinamide N-methyase
MEEIVNPCGDCEPLFSGPLSSGKYHSDITGVIKLLISDEHMEHETTIGRKQQLFASDIWPGSVIMADFLVQNYKEYCSNKIVLELGAGAALPSIVCLLLGSSQVVASDYPSPDILDTILYNIKSNYTESNYSVVGYVWGDDVMALLTQINTQSKKFDVILLAEVLWKDTYPLHRYCTCIMLWMYSNLCH